MEDLMDSLFVSIWHTKPSYNNGYLHLFHNFPLHQCQWKICRGRYGEGVIVVPGRRPVRRQHMLVTRQRAHSNSRHAG